MKTYYLKIRDKFIEAIRNGLKKHEYRLATVDRKNIKIGDTLVVISTTDKKHFVRVTVKKINLYQNWINALRANWSDFENIYPSLDEAIKDCNRFYTRNEVNTYGIICYEIEPLYIDYKNISVLLDTKFNFPLIKSTARHFILPIFPQYHTDLFPDNILKNEDMRLYEENKGHRYAIEKMYLSAAYNIQATAGDIVLIYRNGEWAPKHYTSVITGIAIIQDIITTKTDEERIKICKDKSIFTEKDIRSFNGKYSKVIKLLDYKPFKIPVRLKELRAMNIVDGASGPRPFTEISKEQYEKISQLGSGKQYEE